MADNIYLRAGKKASMPELASREIAYVTDEEALYVGTPDGNVKVNGKELAKKLEATPAAAQAELDLEAEAATIANAFNSLIAAMKASGLMEP